MSDRSGARRGSPDADAWLLYDAQCGFCSRWVPLWGPVLRKAGIGFRPLQSAWARRHVQPSLPMLAQDLTLVRHDGGVLRGADVYRFAMRRIRWARPLYVLTDAPVLRRLFDTAYRAFARNRYRASRICGLEPKAG